MGSSSPTPVSVQATPPTPRSRVAAAPSLPPGPRVRLWQTLRYFVDPYGYYDRMQRRYGNLFTMPSMNGTLVIALDTAGAREILAGGEDDFEAGFGFEAIQPMIGRRSLLLTSGDQHRRDRKLLSPVFTGSRMRSYAADVVTATRTETNTWKHGDELRLRERMNGISIDVILRSVFGVQSPARAAALRDAIYETVVEVNPALLFFRFLQVDLWGIGPWARFKKRMAHLDRLIQQQIDDVRERGGQGEDVLGRMLSARDEDGAVMDDGAIRDHLVTLLMAGHETTGTSLAWAFYELARNPDALARVREELASLGAHPDPAEISKLPFLTAVCQESLRLHPVLAEYFRTVKSEYEIGGYRVPKGITLAGAAIVIHRDPSLYPDPMRFDPDRFLARRFGPEEMGTFGGGHRYCIGAAFAMNEMKLVIATVLSDFDLELVIDRPLKTVRRNATLAPEADVPVRVIARG